MTGTCTARMVAENSGVAREVVYQVIPSLQKKGLIKTIIASPQAYKAIPVKCAYEILTKESEQEHKKLKKETQRSLNALAEIQKEPPEECQITTVTKGKACTSRILAEIKNARARVDIIIAWPKFAKWHHLYAKDQISCALKRNVEFRILLEETQVAKASALGSLLFNTSCFEPLDFRVAESTQLVNMIIFDDKKLFMGITADNALLETSMYSNNPYMTRLATSYFNGQWETALRPFEENKKKALPEEPSYLASKNNPKQNQ